LTIFDYLGSFFEYFWLLWTNFFSNIWPFLINFSLFPTNFQLPVFDYFWLFMTNLQICLMFVIFDYFWLLTTTFLLIIFDHFFYYFWSFQTNWWLFDCLWPFCTCFQLILTVFGYFRQIMFAFCSLFFVRFNQFWPL
jgi:hypothetical protein